MRDRLFANRRSPERGMVAAVLLLTTLLAASTATNVSTNAAAGPIPNRHRLVAGVTTAELPSGPVDIWYPANAESTRGHHLARYDIRTWLPAALRARVAGDPATFVTAAYRNIPPAIGRAYPLVLFAHGLYSLRDQSTFLTTWLASHGFIVAAPEFPLHDLTAYFDPPDSAHTPNDYQVLVETEALVRRMDLQQGSQLYRIVRPGTVAVIGHSLGGMDAIQFSTRPEVATYVALAAGWQSPPANLPAARSLFMTGTADHDVAPGWVKETYRRATPPKTFVTLAGAGHLVFTDFCQVGKGTEGLAALGRHLGVHLSPGAPFTTRAMDGCSKSNPQVAREHSIIDHAVLSDLTSAFSISAPAPRRNPGSSK